jgi:imidazolonepropionase-like amidohydrolase
MRRWVVAASFLAVMGVAATHAVVVPGYAIVGAKIVTVSGATIDTGTVVVRGGEIASVDRGSDAPGDVQRVDGTGLTVYPGLIDLGAETGLDLPSSAAPQNPDSREITERFRRQQLVRAHVRAADVLSPGSADLAKFADAGITNAVVVPRGDGISGVSALIDVVAPEIDPQVGRLAVDLRGGMILRPAVALHVAIPGRGWAGAYPASLMGGIAFVRQALLDAQHYQRAAKLPEGSAARPAYDAALDAIGPALSGTLPVAFSASSAREIRRALAMAAEFSVRPVIVGAHGAAEVAADLKSAGAGVVVSLNLPTRPKALAADADEPLEALQDRDAARKVAGALSRAGVQFGFASAGLKEPKELVSNARVAVQNGLPAEAAIRALTLDAAALAGLQARLGSIERGKRANLIVTDGDLLGEKTKVKHVFVAGRLIPTDAGSAPATR